MKTIPCDEPNTSIGLGLSKDNRVCFVVRIGTEKSTVVMGRSKFSSLLAAGLEYEKAMLELEACEGK